MTKLDNARITFSSCSPYLTASSLANDNNNISSFGSFKNHFYAKWDHCLQIITDQNKSFDFSRFTKISGQCPFKGDQMPTDTRGVRGGGVCVGGRGRGAEGTAGNDL